MSSSDFANVTTDKPHKKLTRSLTRISGRNTYGRITVRRRGGGHKSVAIESSISDEINLCLRVLSLLSKDPNRSARIALSLLCRR